MWYEHQLDAVRKAVEKLKIEPKVIFDVGARDCRESIAFSLFYPEAQIYAFEANPEAVEKCLKNIGPRKRITFVNNAVSDKAELIDFNIDPVEAGRSSFYSDWAGLSKRVKVPATTLIDVCEVESIWQVDILWMDIQGAELKALKGTDLWKVRLIHLEVEFQELYKDQPLFPEIYRHLRKYGFSLYKITAIGPTAGDLIFVEGFRPFRNYYYLWKIKTYLFLKWIQTILQKK